jgi:hypothetical protein
VQLPCFFRNSSGVAAIVVVFVSAAAADIGGVFDWPDTIDRGDRPRCPGGGPCFACV